MGTTLDGAFAFVAEHNQGVLVTLRGDGRPQLSNIYYGLAGGVFSISVTDTRAKVANLRRDPRASLWVPGEDFFQYVVFEGDVTLSDVAASPSDAVADELVELYRSIEGEHDDWASYRRSMVDDHRMVSRLTPTRSYGLWMS